MHMGAGVSVGVCAQGAWMHVRLCMCARACDSVWECAGFGPGGFVATVGAKGTPGTRGASSREGPLEGQRLNGGQHITHTRTHTHTCRVKTLVLDLDDLLVHKEWTRQMGWKIFKRPGVQVGPERGLKAWLPLFL